MLVFAISSFSSQHRPRPRSQRGGKGGCPSYRLVRACSCICNRLAVSARANKTRARRGKLETRGATGDERVACSLSNQTGLFSLSSPSASLSLPTFTLQSSVRSLSFLPLSPSLKSFPQVSHLSRQSLLSLFVFALEPGESLGL